MNTTCAGKLFLLIGQSLQSGLLLPLSRIASFLTHENPLYQLQPYNGRPNNVCRGTALCVLSVYEML